MTQQQTVKTVKITQLSRCFVFAHCFGVTQYLEIDIPLLKSFVCILFLKKLPSRSVTNAELSVRNNIICFSRY